ncbi:hypothetical protein [Mucilaginibacter sp.]|uniref:hypothetical protein n=1 Tax=Mucilaginibacter sp. TaxID=1882438 RepID=UPI003265D10F
MGTWGTAISSNDTFADIYADFFEQYNDGAVPQITSNLIKVNKEIINDDSDSNNFWFAIAKAQWECKALEPSIFRKVKEIIESGADLLLWQELDANSKDLRNRKIALDKFLADISSERAKPKPRKKPIVIQAPFAKGDCITFKLDNGNYGGAVVLEAINDHKTASNLIATTNLNQSTRPTKKDFLSAAVLILTFAAWNEKPLINWIFAVGYKREQHLFEIAHKIEVKVLYETKDTRYSFGGGFERIIIQSANDQFTTNNPQSTKTITVKQLIEKNKFKFW